MERPQPEQLLSQARMSALKEAGPEARLALLEALITEGDHSMADFALAALEEIPDDTDDSAKITAGRRLAEAFTDQALFTQAEAVVHVLAPLDGHAMVETISDLLRAGYTGNNDRFLHIDFTDYMADVRADPYSLPTDAFTYLYGLAEYGANVFDPQTPAGALYREAMAVIPTQIKREFYINNIVYSYATAGRIGLALAAQQRLQDPYYWGVAGTFIGKAPEANEAVASAQLSGIAKRLDAVGECRRSCGRVLCNSTIDLWQLEIGMAGITIRLGQLDTTRNLLGLINDPFAYDQALLYAELYRLTGEVIDRTAALEGLVSSSVFQKYKLAGALVGTICDVDSLRGKTVPSPVADDESVPLICWELHDLYARKHRVEDTDMIWDNADSLYALGLSPEQFLQDIAAARKTTRDYCLAELIKRTHGVSPKTSAYLMSLIENRTQIVRTQTAIGLHGRT